MSENEARLAQALSTAAWWLKELSKILPQGQREQALLAGGDASKIVNLALDGKPLPDWLAPIFDESGQ